MDREAQQLYKINFGDEPCGDITEIDAEDIGSHDILTAGFPCQSFSKVGEGKGLDDPRGIGMLFLEIVRVLRANQPRGFILENVSNLVYIDNGKTLEIILARLRDVGYLVSWRLFNSRLVVPQQRSRVYIVGVRKDLATKCCEGKKDKDDGGGVCFEFLWPELPCLDTQVADVLEGVEVDRDPRYADTASVRQASLDARL